jgi:hypothetical protein
MKPAERKSIEQLTFPGAIGNMPFRAITMNQFINALKQNGWREAHNAHIYQRLLERGKEFGIHTPNDLASALRYGFTQPADDGASRRVCQGGACWIIFKDQALITIRHSDDRC